MSRKTFSDTKESGNSLRQRIAFEAARIMADHGWNDYHSARRKAAERLGCTNRRLLPDSAEIERALREHQGLFLGRRQPAVLQRLRRLAAEVMTEMERFNPRLVGAVLSGTADIHSTVQLHLFTETPEQLDLYLLERGIPWHGSDTTLRFKGGAKETYPVYRFQAGETEMEFTLFPPEGIRQTPLAPYSDHPQERASLPQVKKWLEESDAPSSRSPR